MEWVWKGGLNFDFFTVDNMNIRLFALNEEKFILTEVGIIPTELPFAWFEVIHSILLYKIAQK